MGTRNQNLERADITIAQLDTDGGLLEPEQANAFIDMIMEENTILPQVRVIRMTKPEHKINRLGFGTRILHPAPQTGSANDDGSNDRYLAKAKRSAPTTAQIQLVSHEYMGEIRIPYELLEDNIEGQSLEAHIMRLMAKQVALDLEEFGLWSDTASGDAALAMQNGWLKRINTHVVDNLGAGVNPDLFVSAMLALPQRYLRYLDSMRGFISVANTLRYRQKISQRMTGYGDSALQQQIPLMAQGLKLEGTPMLAADDIGATGLVTFPKNLIFGIRRDITVETDKDIRSREYIIVVTVRAGYQVDDLEAAVKLEDI